MNYDIKDKTLAAKGKLRIEWAERDMPVLDTGQGKIREKPGA